MFVNLILYIWEINAFLNYKQNTLIIILVVVLKIDKVTVYYFKSRMKY